VGAIQANRPAPPDQDVFYFEVQVLDAGEASKMSIGFTSPDAKLSRQIG